MFGGSKSNTTTKNTATPNAATSSLFDPNFAQAQQDFSAPVTAYSGELAPGLSTGQQQAGGLVQANLGVGNDAVNSAAGTAQGVAGYTPQQVAYGDASGASAGPTSLTGATGYGATSAQAASAGPASLAAQSQVDPNAVQQINAGLLSNTNLSNYTDPNTAAVIDPTLQYMEQQRNQAINQQAGQFTQAGAFGGSREGVADALTNQAWGNTEATTIAQLESQAFQNAQAQAQTDLNRQLTAGQSNQGTALAAGTTNADLGQAANLANSAATNAMNQYNAGNTQQANLVNAGAQNTASQFGASAQNTAASQNAAASNQNAQYNASNQQQAGLLNAQELLAAQQANQQAGLAGQGLNLSAASQLAAMGGQQQQMGLLGANAVNAFGQEQQQTQAAQDSAAYQDYLRQIQQQINQGQGLTGLGATLPALYAGATTNGTSNTSQTGWNINVPQIMTSLFGGSGASGTGPSTAANAVSLFAG